MNHQRRQIVYLTKRVPSGSGVAHYSQSFVEVLKQQGPVRIVGRLHEAQESQRPLKMLTTLTQTLKACRASNTLFVELSGRSLAEFYAVLFVRQALPSLQISITLHDVPAITGGAFFVSPLDRRGGRRLARHASDAWGRRLEQRLLDRVDHVFVLTEMGATALAKSFGFHDAKVLPHVAPAAALPPRRRDGSIAVFCPGYLSSSDVLPVIHLVACSSQDVRLTIGACPDEDEVLIRAHARSAGVRVAFTGLVSSLEDLRSTFRNTDLCIRLRGAAEHRPANWAAASGPLMLAIAEGCAVVTNDARGTAAELASTGAIVLRDTPEAACAAAGELLLDADRLLRLRARAHATAVQRYSIDLVAARLRACWR